MGKDLCRLYAAAAAGVPCDEKLGRFADECITAAKEPVMAKTALAKLVMPAAEFKAKEAPENKLVLLQLQVVCRLALQVAGKVDPWSKTQKKELVSLLSLLAMAMDAASMQSSSHEQLYHEHSAFTWFVLDMITPRFQKLLPKTLKRLYTTLEIETTDAKPEAPVVQVPLQLPKELSKEPMTRQTSNEYVIAEVLSQETTTYSAATNPLPVQQLGSFKQILLPTIKPIVKLSVKPAVLNPVVAPKTEAAPSFPSPRVTKDSPATSLVKQPMVMKTPERPQRPAAKKRLVLVASSPPLRRPAKRNISALSLLKKPE
ncbi:hypothetical protein ACHHYP_12681 [Achlya hypogyna]|uniref:Uncharacterized protein n=1 Tax=Achlya hypogyna TaxID=1202772 RepID=A0A1V9ZGN8_ACHHY|nr:hypothetical protein ACHHYP_12681 [Achlya hypogyna]